MCVPPPALAQSAYVAGALGADVSRSSHADSSFYPSPSNDAEVLSGALRVGTSVGSIWGVELEFVRSGRSDNDGPIVSPLAQTGGISAAVQLLPPGVIPGTIPFPGPFDYRSDVRRRHTSIDAVAWARQPIADTIDLVYLGGIAFSRERSDMTQNIIPVLRTVVPATTYRSTFIEYATRPLVGVEARIGLASKIRLVPGVRVQGLGNGWLVRPSVGLAWFF